MVDLVTGATGFIGGSLVRRLIADGGSVRALVRGDGDRVSGLGATPIRGDLTDAGSLAAAVAGVRCVYHLAARLGDWGPAEAFVRTNVEGTRHLLEAAASAGCQRFVLVSSFAVYGDALLQAEPCTEDRPLDSFSGGGTYGESKRRAEALARAQHDPNGMSVTIVRPGNVYGPASPLWVEEVLKVLRAGGVPNIDGGRGRATLAYVDNVVDLLVRAGRSETAGGRTYNATDGDDVTWGQYIAELAQAAGLRPPRASVPGWLAAGIGAVMEAGAHLVRKQDRPPLTREAVAVFRCQAPVPIDRARAELGFEPPVPYAAGMARVRDWLAQKHPSPDRQRSHPS